MGSAIAPIAAAISGSRGPGNEMNAEAAVPDSIDRLAHDVMFGILSECPDLAADLGIDSVDGQALPMNGMPDFSAGGAGRRDAMMRGWQERLSSVPADRIPKKDVITRDVLHYILTKGVQNRFVGVDGQVHADHIEPLTHLTGVHATAMQLVAAGPVDVSRERLAAWLERLARLPDAVTDATEALRLRRRAGFVLAEILVRRAAADIRLQLAENNAFVRALGARQAAVAGYFGTNRLESARDIVGRRLKSSYSALTDELDRHAECRRESISALSRKGGDAFYAWRLTALSTTKTTPEEAHRAGLDELRRLDGEFREAFAALGLRGSRAENFAAFAAANAYSPGEAGRAEAERDLRNWLAEAREATRPLFRLWPRAEAEIEIMPLQDEASQHSYYRAPSASRGGRGVFLANLSHVVATGKAEAAIVCFHETWPGHHLQLSIAAELEASTFRRAVLFRSFLEGWAKYAESLPESVGLGNPHTRIARLRTELYSTATLAMDTGVHHHGWSAERARDFFVAETAAPAALADMVVMRSVASPGDLCTYKIGMQKVRALKGRFADAHPGSEIRDFHDALLQNGALPFEVLDNLV